MKIRKIVFCIAVCFLVFSAGCTPDQYEPKDGVWYCKELQIQLSYDTGKECFAIINGEKIVTACGSDRGVDRLYVSVQHINHPDFDLGETIFDAKIVSVNDQEFVVYDESEQMEYVFYRVE